VISSPRPRGFYFPRLLPIIIFLEIRDSRLTCRKATLGKRVLSSRVELASAGELILHNDSEMANEQGRGRDQLSNNNKIHNQILYVFQAGAVYVSRRAPR